MTGCPGTRCPCRQLDGRAGPHSTWWPRHTARNGCCRSSSASTAAGRPRSSGRRRRVGHRAGPTITRSAASKRPVRVALVADDGAGHAEHGEHVPQHVHEVVLAVEDRPRSPASAGAGGAPAWSVNQNRLSRWLREFSAISTSSSRARSAISSPAPAPAGTRPNAVRMPPALACVSATSYAGSESLTSVAPAVTFSSPAGLYVRRTDDDGGVRGRASGLVAAEQRQRGAVVYAEPILSRRDRAWPRLRDTDTNFE